MLFALVLVGPMAVAEGAETPELPVLVADIHQGAGPGSRPKEFTALGGQTFFTAFSEPTGWELWRTDATADGTRLVADIQPGRWDSNPFRLSAIGDLLFFVAEREDTGRELWRTDGTAEGTRLLEIVPGPQGSTPSYPWS